MMRKLGGLALVIAVALALFFGGAALLPQRDRGQTEGTSAAELASISLGLAGADLDATISALESRVAAGGFRAAEDHTSLAFAYLQKARVEAKPELYDEAEDQLEESLDLQAEGNFRALLGKGILAGSRHDFHGQLEWSSRAVKVNPANAQARGVVGDAYLELGQRSKAASVYQEMLDIRPDLPSWGRVSYLKQLQGDTPSAISAMESALQFAGPSGPDDAWASWQLGELHMSSSRYGRAASYYDRALEASPGFGPAREASAHLAAATGDIDGAVSILSELVTEFPLPDNIAFLGDLYLLQGDDQAADQAYALADDRFFEYMEHEVRTDVDFITFWADRGLHLERALTDARTLYSQRDSAAVSDSLAWALYATGRYEQAAPYADEALERSNRDAGYHFHAGMIAIKLDQPRRAEKLLTKALALDPVWSILDASRARDALESL
jgi:tetratricopeptide (TPR) repeat protein